MTEKKYTGDAYTGLDLEVDLFGSMSMKPGFKEACVREATETGYIPYQRAMELIREFYPQDPTNPKQEFARELRMAVAEILNLPEDQWDQIRFYSALRTALDIFHGVDAWIEWERPNPQGRGKPELRVVTFDATKREEKIQEGYKADIIVGDIVEPEADEFLDQVSAYSAQVADQLKAA